MDIKKLKQIIRSVVVEEMRTQKSEIIKEVKADLFDVIMTSNNAAPAQVTSATPIAPIAPQAGNSNYRALFEDMNPLDQYAGAGGSTPSPSFNIPDTYKHQPLNPSQIKVVDEVVNKDYSALMKKMGMVD